MQTEATEFERMLEDGRPLYEVETWMESQHLDREAKAQLWLRACLCQMARREAEEGWRYRQLGDEEWISG